jgi:FAD/FMN-containing dehydrogenase
MTTRLLDLVAPSDPRYDADRAAWNTSVDQRPALIATVASVHDVIEAVRVARSHGLRIAPQGTGHRASALPPLDGTLLLRTSGLDEVTVDPLTRIARIGAGATWRDVIDAAAPHGLAAPHGYAAGVGVTGYLLGGGLGWLSRSHGFGSSRVRGFEVVTTAGEPLRVDQAHEPHLFWSLRGGGSSGVIVTAIELELIELREAYAGAVLWPIEYAPALVHAYRECLPTLPDALTSSLRLVRPPRGGAFVQLTLALQGSADTGQALVAPLRAVAPAMLDTLATVPAQALAQIAGDPEDPMPAASTSLLLGTLTPAAADAFVSLADPALTVLELRHLGGALRRQQGAIGGVQAQALLFASGPPGVSAALRALRAGLAPWAHPRGTLPTFDDGRTEPDAQLREIAARHDPEGILLSA